MFDFFLQRPHHHAARLSKITTSYKRNRDIVREPMDGILLYATRGESMGNCIQSYTIVEFVMFVKSFHGGNVHLHIGYSFLNEHSNIVLS